MYTEHIHTVLYTVDEGLRGRNVLPVSEFKSAMYMLKIKSLDPFLPSPSVFFPSLLPSVSFPLLVPLPPFTPRPSLSRFLTSHAPHSQMQRSRGRRRACHRQCPTHWDWPSYLSWSANNTIQYSVYYTVMHTIQQYSGRLHRQTIQHIAHRSIICMLVCAKHFIQCNT